jgi:hypothetical protein
MYDSFLLKLIGHYCAYIKLIVKFLKKILKAGIFISLGKDDVRKSSEFFF